MKSDLIEGDPKMSDPYRRTARALDEATTPKKRKLQPKPAPSAEVPMQVVGKRYMDPESLANEEYMTGAQGRINRRLAEGAERMSEEMRFTPRTQASAPRPKRKGFGLKRNFIP